MPHISDVMFNTMRARGYAGAMPEMLLQFWNAGLSGGGPGPGPVETFNITAQTVGSIYTGYRQITAGTIDNPRTNSGRAIFDILTRTPPTTNQFIVALRDITGELTQDYFSGVEIPGITDGILNTADAAFALAGSGEDVVAQWIWPDSYTAMSSSTAYTVNLYGLPEQLDENVVYSGQLVAGNQSLAVGFDSGGALNQIGSMTPPTLDNIPGGPATWERLAYIGNINRSDIGLTPTTLVDADTTWQQIEIIGLTDTTYKRVWLRSDYNPTSISEGRLYWLRDVANYQFVSGHSYSVVMRSSIPFINTFITTGSWSVYRGYHLTVGRGTIGDATVPDRSYIIQGVFSQTNNDLFLRLSESFVPNTDAEFSRLLIYDDLGNVLANVPRNAGAYTANVDGETQWRWSVGAQMANGQTWNVVMERS